MIIENPVRSLNDGMVIAASVDEPERFAEIFDSHAPIIERYLARRVGSDLARDLLSATFLAAFGKRARFDTGQKSALPWLYGFASVEVARHRRAEGRRFTLARRLPVETEPAFEDTALERVSAQAQHGDLADALARLREGERTVLLLFAWEELSYDQIAAALDIPIGTVRSRLSRARAKLAARLGTDRAATD